MLYAQRQVEESFQQLNADTLGEWVQQRSSQDALASALTEPHSAQVVEVPRPQSSELCFYHFHYLRYGCEVCLQGTYFPVNQRAIALFPGASLFLGSSQGQRKWRSRGNALKVLGLGGSGKTAGERDVGPGVVVRPECEGCAVGHIRFLSTREGLYPRTGSHIYEYSRTKGREYKVFFSLPQRI